MYRIALSLSVALTVASFAVGSTDGRAAVRPIPKPLRALLVTIDERLNVADKVALAKWDNGKPVQDSEREAQVIASAEQQATGLGLAPSDVRDLFAAQIEANKLIQYQLMSQWQGIGKAPPLQSSDSLNVIRPQLDALQVRLLREYADFQPYRADPDCRDWLSHARTQFARDRLHYVAMVRATGELCSPPS